MMKRIVVILKIMLIPLIGINHPAGEKYTELSVAGEKHLVKYSINGDSKGTHYIKPLVLSLENLKNENLTIHVSNGLQLTAKDSVYQDFIITREEIIVLKPHEKKDVSLYAMCTQASDRAPSATAVYTVSKKSDDRLKEITSLIQRYKSFETAGQNAIWAVTDNYSLENITGYDTTQAKRLIRLVSKLTGRPVPPPPAGDDYRRNYYSMHTFIDKIGGKFEYQIPKEMEIRIAMFDKNGMVVRELYSNPHEQAGYHQFNFEFDASVYTDKFYYIRLLVDGNVKVSRKISLE